MKLNKEQIDQLARLSRLKFTQEEEKKIQADLEKMLNFMEKLQEVDTEGISPLTHMADDYCSLRDDSAELPIDQEQALKNSPHSDGEYFLVPKVIHR